MRSYFLLTKPGILFGNAITAIGGFALASQNHFDIWLFLAMITGLSCIIASACVFNNYQDRDIDEKMARTRNRALVRGTISIHHAIIFASLLLASGILILFLFTNVLTVSCALFGFFVYVFLYGFWKYRSIHGTIIGSFAGAVPPVVGYCAVTDRFDLAALLLFLMIMLWQMPHFFAIALYRLEDYANARIPVLPLIKGIYVTKIHMLMYIIVFVGVTLLFTILGYTGLTFLVAAILLGSIWLILSILGFKSGNDQRWARRMFLFSLIHVTALCVVISFDGI